MHQEYSADTAGVDRGYIRSSIRAGNFLSDHTRPSHKNWSALVVGWSAVWCDCSFKVWNLVFGHFFSQIFGKKL